ncbi:MAG: hypothetical protein L3J82_08305 [Planctomycetes bacterium]|nr:hypothetical protein [Planctomycetota bacterium]
MRLIPLLALFVSSCSVGVYRHYTPDTYVDEPTAAPSSNYPQSYTPPSQRDASWFATEAEIDRKVGDFSEAHINYQRAFRRDRWHPAANEGYQDMMLNRGLFDDLWREYLDAWQKYPTRGDAFWLHVRPMLHQNGIKSVRQARAPKVSADDEAAANELLKSATENYSQGEVDAALGDIDRALELADTFELHRLKISYTPKNVLVDLVMKYGERAEEDPSNGDNQALLSLAIARTDRLKAIELLRDGWVLDLPGIELRRILAELTRDLGDETEGSIIISTRQRRGWYQVSAAFFSIVLATNPDDIAAQGGQNYAQNKLK